MPKSKKSQIAAVDTDQIVDHQCGHSNGCGYCVSLVTQNTEGAIAILRAKNAVIASLRKLVKELTVWRELKDLPETGYVLAAYQSDHAVVTVNASYVRANSKWFTGWLPIPEAYDTEKD